MTIIVAAALVMLGLMKLNLSQVGHSIALINGGWAALGTVLMLSAFLARAESWFGALRVALPAHPLGRLAVTRVLLIGMAGSSVAPARLGEAARAWLIARRAGSTREVLATVVGTLMSQSLLNILALAILAAVALAGGALPGVSSEVIIATIALPVALLIVLASAPRILRAGDRRGLGVLDRPATWIIRQLIDVRQGLRVFAAPRAAVHSAGFQLGAWTLQCGACYAIILAFGMQQRATVATAAAVLLAVNITALLPLTPANVGVFQAACIAVLTPLGISASRAFGYGLILQATEIISALALGLPSLAHEGLTLRDLRRPASGTFIPSDERLT
jgi:phosphatidylinositol alpha-mannosyltransferase